MPTIGNIPPVVGMARLNNGASEAECNRRTPRRRNMQTSARTSFGRTSTDLCSQNSGRACTMNPYLGYDTSPKLFLYNGDMPKGIKPLAYVLAVGDDAWSLDLIKRKKRIEAGDLVITCASGQKSALLTAITPKGAISAMWWFSAILPGDWWMRCMTSPLPLYLTPSKKEVRSKNSYNLGDH